jgi:hypothetical protein
MRIFISAAVILAFMGVFCIEWSTPPINLLEKSRRKIFEAKKSRAHKVTPGLFKEAEVSYDSALIELNLENDKVKAFRNYSKMESHLNDAIKLAELAERTAIVSDRKNRTEIEDKYFKVKDLLEHFNMTYSNFPLTNEERQQLSATSLKLDEIQLNLKGNTSSLLNKKLDECHRVIDELASSYESLLQSYFFNYNTWEKLQIDAIRNSLNNREKLLIIDKLNRACKVYDNGKFSDVFAVELGYNWIGDKRQAGDKTTPEGQYKIIKKKERGDTKYYKALLINYPNEDDKKNHTRNIEAKVIAKNSPIGGNIEIHGMGGKGTDWTDGCIALKNDDMDKLYAIVSNNTTVIIVGSSIPLEDLFIKP